MSLKALICLGIISLMLAHIMYPPQQMRSSRSIETRSIRRLQRFVTISQLSAT